ncbi:hypothetical protein PGQ11_014607 [Apiospora arundinis]|uniref:Myb-like domain-containing protein n=1 Tax=Apiospora arundinis TaxID=335852 RepID=A0ABR2HTB4_9PEZI
MSDNSSAVSKSSKAAEKAASYEFTPEDFKLMMIIWEDQNPGFPVQNWERHAARAGISIAKAKQQFAKARDAYLEQMKDNVPAVPVIKPRKKRARVGPEEDAEASPAHKKSKSRAKDTDEQDNSDSSPERPVGEDYAKKVVKSRVPNSKNKIDVKGKGGGG